MRNGTPAGIHRYSRVLVLLLVISAGITAVMAEPLTNNRHIFINVANNDGVKFDLDGAKYGGPSNTYYIKADGGGLNELHITTDPMNSPFGQVTETSAQSGTFYVSNTGGRGFDNDIILLIAVREPVPNDFSVQIKSSGYTWTPAPSGAYTPPPPTDYSRVTNAVSETFTKADFIYGPQVWKPGPGALGDMSLPLFNGQDITNTSDTFQLMFIDLKAGNMRPGLKPDLVDNGAVKIEYAFSNLDTFAALNAYGWCSGANQDQGISWTNPTRDFDANGGATQSGQSGFSVIGTPRSSSRGGGVPVLPVSGSAAPVNPDLYGYKGKTLGTIKTGTVNGTIRFFSDSDLQPILANNRVRNINLSVDLPPGSNISFARMYLYVSKSHNLQTGKGVIPSFGITLDKKDLRHDQMYIDTDGDDSRYLAATYAYDAGEMLVGNWTSSVSVRNLDHEQSVFTIEGVLLAVAYENETTPVTRYWIDEGCDVVLSQPEKGLLPDDCETSYPFSGTVNMSTAGDAYLYLVSTGLDQDNATEHTVRFNTGTWHNLLETVNNSWGTQLQVRASLNETANTLNIRSAIRSQEPDYLVNRNAILVIEQREPEPVAVTLNTSNTERGEDVFPANLNDTLPFMNESQSCRITLDSDPEGALVYIDDRYLGKTTPYSLDAGQGEYHRVRFELDGYVPSETSFVVTNSTCICAAMYTPVYSPKGRLPAVPEDPDGTQYGGLSISSRPNGALISIDGISTGKITPSVFMGLAPGKHTVKLTRDAGSSGNARNDEFVFTEQTAWVVPGVLGIIDVNGIGYNLLSEIIVDSHGYRGSPLTMNGYVTDKTVPARMSTPHLDSFVTIYDNESFISFPIPMILDTDRYLLFEPRNNQNLSIAVNSSPRGAEVFIDGFRTGYTTPYTFENISDGPHRIMVTKNGYVPQQSLIDLTRRTIPISMSSIDFDLEEYPSGFLYVDSIPPGGRIEIDGLSSGELTPTLFRSMPIGVHSVKVSGTNTTKTFSDITINSLRLTNLTADFTPQDDD